MLGEQNACLKCLRVSSNFREICHMEMSKVWKPRLGKLSGQGCCLLGTKGDWNLTPLPLVVHHLCHTLPNQRRHCPHAFSWAFMTSGADNDKKNLLPVSNTWVMMIIIMKGKKAKDHATTIQPFIVSINGPKRSFLYGDEMNGSGNGLLSLF